MRRSKFKLALNSSSKNWKAINHVRGPTNALFTFYRHMKEHMDVPIDTSNMSEQELQFHYFKMHDSDGNNKLGKLKSISLT